MVTAQTRFGRSDKEGCIGRDSFGAPTRGIVSSGLLFALCSAHDGICLRYGGCSTPSCWDVSERDSVCAGSARGEVMAKNGIPVFRQEMSSSLLVVRCLARHRGSQSRRSTAQ